MSSNAFLQPVGCVTQSFVLEPLVGLSPPEPIVPSNPLWSGYWSQGELCVLTGDTGAGKTILALQLGKEMAATLPLKVLYIGHEYDKRGFAERFGPIDEDLAGKFFFARFNRKESGVHKTYADFKEWLVLGLKSLLDTTGAQVLIFDQPDRLNLSNLQWIEFLNVVEELRMERGLSVLLVVSTRNRNTGRPVELFHTYKHQYTTTFADSVVAVCRTHTNHCTRYQKLLKCKNRAMPGFNKVHVFQIINTDDNHLLIHSLEDEEDEYTMLPKTAAMRRMDKQHMAESFRKEGLGFARIAELLGMPESTVRGWLSRIAVNDRFTPPKEGEYGLLPAHMRDGYKPMKNPFKDDLPDEEILEETGDEPATEKIANVEETELRKDSDELHTVGIKSSSDLPEFIGGFRVKICV
jgi:KaiC/GvpD/RAD55 family RecA-like ATPase